MNRLVHEDAEVVIFVVSAILIILMLAGVIQPGNPQA